MTVVLVLPKLRMSTVPTPVTASIAASMPGDVVVGAAHDRRGLRAVEAQGERLAVGVEATQRHRLDVVDRRAGGGDGVADVGDAALREVRVAVRLEVVLLADAGVGHDRAARAGLVGRAAAVARAVELGAVEGVRAAELVADLVRDVVDGEVVALRRGQTGAAAGLAVTADHAEAGDAAAVHAEREVAHVVAGGADELAEHDAVAVERGAGAAGELGGREARSRAARTVGLGGLGGGVEVELVGVVDEHHPDREVVVVDLVHPVHQGDLLGEHVGGAEVVGVRRVGDQRQAVGPQAHLGAGGFGQARAEALDGVLVELGLDQAAVTAGQVAVAVGEVDAVVAVPGRVDVPGGTVTRAADRGVEAHRREVEADRGGRVADGATGVGGQLGVAGGEAVLHHGDLVDAEVDEVAVGRGDGHDGTGAVGAGGVLGGRPVEGRADAGAVQGEGGVALRLHAPLDRTPVTAGALVGRGPVAVVGWGRGAGEGEGLQAREGDDGGDEQGQVTQRTGHPDPRISRRDGG